MNIIRTYVLAALTLFGWVTNTHASVIYSVDDGSSETAVGLFGGSGDVWFAQGFTQLPGGEQIVSIEIAYGSPTISGGSLPNGTPVTLLLYDDPTNDLNPSDAVLLTSAATSVQNADTDTFISVSIPNTLVSGDFFVAVLATSVNNLNVIGLDTATDAGVAWAAAGTALNPNNIIGTADLISLTNLSSGGLPGNLLLRATGESVPEPATLLLMGLSLAGLGFARRRRNNA